MNFLEIKRVKNNYSAVINIFTQVAFWLYQPYFKFSGMDIAYFGVFFASFQLVSGISSKYAHKIEKIFGKRYLFGMLIFLLAGSFFLMGNFIFCFYSAVCKRHQKYSDCRLYTSSNRFICKSYRFVG